MKGDGGQAGDCLRVAEWAKHWADWLVCSLRGTPWCSDQCAWVQAGLNLAWAQLDWRQGEVNKGRRRAVREWAVHATTDAGGGLAHRWTQVQVAWSPVTTPASLKEGRAASDQEVVEAELGTWEKI